LTYEENVKTVIDIAQRRRRMLSREVGNTLVGDGAEGRTSIRDFSTGERHLADMN
jgi:hypothetical protein